MSTLGVFVICRPLISAVLAPQEVSCCEFLAAFGINAISFGAASEILILCPLKVLATSPLAVPGWGVAVGDRPWPSTVRA